jgi:hypothetical protein
MHSSESGPLMSEMSPGSALRYFRSNVWIAPRAAAERTLRDGLTSGSSGHRVHRSELFAVRSRLRTSSEDGLEVAGLSQYAKNS